MKKILFICMILITAGTAAAAAGDANVTQIPIGSSREEVHALIGAPQTVSAGGYKETYLLENGKSAVLNYIGDTLDTGFIVINEK